MNNEFGGEWTRKKLDALKAYLLAYETIFSKTTLLVILLAFI